MENWWEGSASTAIPPTSALDVMGQHHKIGGIIFRAALILYELLKIFFIKVETFHKSTILGGI